MTDGGGLAALEARVAADLEALGLPRPNWVKPHHLPDGALVHDVVVVGAGMAGLAATFALQCVGITNVATIDQAEAGREGPWVTYARMETLRTPKHFPGPALGVPSLTFRAWYEARSGAGAYAALGKAPRAVWMDYLVWYRKVLALPVTSAAALRGIGPDRGVLRLEVERAGAIRPLWARRVVLATGREGFGGFRVPAVLAALPADRVSHTGEAIDFARLKGRQIAVLGGGASAVDNAACALEAGAAAVHMFLRQPAMPRIHKFLPFAHPGFVHGFATASDAQRWRAILVPTQAGVPPPRDSLLRCTRHAAFRLHPGAAWHTAALENGAIVADTGAGRFVLDHVIAATGFRVDIAAVPELAALAPHVALWRDRYAPPAGEEHEEMGRYPYLRPDFALQEKIAGDAPWLSAIRVFSNAATQSLGFISSDVPGLSEGAARLAAGLAADLFGEDAGAYVADLAAFDVAELQGDECPPDPGE